MIVVSFVKSFVSCAVKLWRGGVLQSFDIPSRVNSGGSRLETQGGPTIFFCRTTYKLLTYNKNSRY
jgi:hypothetical protein